MGLFIGEKSYWGKGYATEAIKIITGLLRFHSDLPNEHKAPYIYDALINVNLIGGGIELSMPVLPSEEDWLKGESLKTFQGTPCVGQERIAFRAGWREYESRLKELNPNINFKIK